MKYLRILIALVGLAVFPAAALSQQCGSCPAPWDDGGWRSMCYDVDSLECCFYYHYLIRTGCGGNQEIQIDSILTQGTNSACSFERLLYEALRNLIADNPMHFSPDSDGCATNWRVTGSSCWSGGYFVSIAFGNGDLYAPCSDSLGCCFQFYRVCRDSAGNLTSLTREDRGFASGNDCDTTCPYYSCLPIRNLDEPPPSGTKRTTGSSIENELTIGLVRPNPTTGRALLSVTAQDAGELKLVVVASNGDIVLEKRLEVGGAGERVVTLDLDGVPGGTYQYVVTQEGRPASRGQIKVLR